MSHSWIEAAGKALIFVGAILAAVGLILVSLSKFPFLHLGRLPGDIVYKRRNFSFYFPVMTCVLLSILLMALGWLVSLLMRRGR